MNITINIANADKNYNNIMEIINKLREDENIEEIAGNINSDEIEISFNVKD